MSTVHPLLTLEHIEQVYGNGHRGFTALDDVNLSVSEGEFVALLGPSGCGKSFILTPLGETFAEASILARKEIFAARIKRLPFFKWLISMLKAAENRRLQWEVVQRALQLEFPEEEAERQVDTAVNWGRYAEILAYEDNTGTIYLEPVAGLTPE